MNTEKILQAEIEAKRFLKALEAYKQNKFSYSPKESGALRRSSMDLTRSLAELRKSN